MGAPNSNIRAKQCAALLALLNATPASTMTIRQELGILSPAARVLDLRKQGYQIETISSTAYDEAGRPHRCATYALRLPLDLEGCAP